MTATRLILTYGYKIPLEAYMAFRGFTWEAIPEKYKDLEGYTEAVLESGETWAVFKAKFMPEHPDQKFPFKRVSVAVYREEAIWDWWDDVANIADEKLAGGYTLEWPAHDQQGDDLDERFILVGLRHLTIALDNAEELVPEDLAPPPLQSLEGLKALPIWDAIPNSQKATPKIWVTRDDCFCCG